MRSLTNARTEPITAGEVVRVKAAVAAGSQTREVARALHLSISVVQRIRQGYYEDRVAGASSPSQNVATEPTPAPPASVAPPFRALACAARPSIDPAGVPARLRHRLDWPLASLGLNPRVVNALEGERYHTLGQLLAASRGELKTVPNLAGAVLRHILAVVARWGFRPPTRRRDWHGRPEQGGRRVG